MVEKNFFFFICEIFFFFNWKDFFSATEGEVSEDEGSPRGLSQFSQMLNLKNDIENFVNFQPDLSIQKFFFFFTIFFFFRTSFDDTRNLQRTRRKFRDFSILQFHFQLDIKLCKLCRFYKYFISKIFSRLGAKIIGKSSDFTSIYFGGLEC